MSKSQYISAVTRKRLKASVSVGAIALLSSVIAVPAQALVVRDDVGVDGAVDTANQWAGVGQMWNRILNADGTVSTFVCTGQLINPRTVIFAQHCTSGVTDEGYGPGQANHMGFSFNPTDSFSGFDDWRRDANGVINNPITGLWESLPGQDFYNVLQVQSVFNTAEFFPGGDVTMASFDTPLAGLPTYGMLFSALTGPTHASVVGYGSTGTGSLGDNIGLDFKRRAGENMIDGLFSQNDFLAAEFAVPGFGFGSADAAQLLYHIDFDKPDRVANDCSRAFAILSPNDLLCNTFPPGPGPIFTLDGTTVAVPSQHIDWYPGDALPNEAGTAGGDSGSALFADQIYSRPLITGVLSGGWVDGVSAPIGGGYGDVAYYNPLFLFRDWIVENNPYVYASARNGSGNWSDPGHWVQNMDPNYFYIDQFGKVRNGLPAQPQPGYFADAPKWGTIFDTDASTSPGDTGPDLFLCELDPTFACPPGVTAAASGFAKSGVGTFNGAESGVFGLPRSGTAGPTASNTGPTGPGSSGFVPNNDFGTYGGWTGASDGTARFYDVTLNNIGTTRVNINVEIDNLTVSGLLTGLDVKAGRNLNALIAVDQQRGLVNVDGTIGTREYMLWGGALTGDGAINAATLYNVNGTISAGGLLSTGNLTINGDFVQTSHGAMLVNIFGDRNGVSNDHIQVNGGASLAGLAVATLNNSKRILRWQDTFTVLSANNVVGNFDNVYIASPVLFGVSSVSGGDVSIQIQARKLGSIFAATSPLQSLGAALDQIRWGGGYASLDDVFSLVDSSSFENFGARLFSLTPQSAFSQAGLLASFDSTFIQHLSARNAELRAGLRGVSYNGLRGAFANAERAGAASTSSTDTQSSFSQQSAVPAEEKRLGMFISSQGFYNANSDRLNPGAFQSLTSLDPEVPGASYDPLSSDSVNYGDLTIGADYRLSDTLAVGVSLSANRFDLSSDGASPLGSSSIGLSAYATKYGKNWYVDGYYGVSQHDFSAERMSPGLGANPDPFASYDGLRALSAATAQQTVAGMRAGYTFEPAKGFVFGPMASLAYSDTRFDSYSEFGAGQFDLIVGERNLTSIAASTGATLRYNHLTRGGKLITAFGEMSASREFGDTREVIPAAFALAPNTWFEVDRLLDTSWYSASAGLTYLASDKLSTSLVVGGDFDRGPLSQYYTSMRFNFSF